MEIYELLSLSRVGSTSKLPPDWLHKSEQQPIRSQLSKLTQLLTTTIQLISFHTAGRPAEDLPGLRGGDDGGVLRHGRTRRLPPPHPRLLRRLPPARGRDRHLLSRHFLPPQPGMDIRPSKPFINIEWNNYQLLKKTLVYFLSYSTYDPRAQYFVNL